MQTKPFAVKNKLSCDIFMRWQRRYMRKRAYQEVTIKDITNLKKGAGNKVDMLYAHDRSWWRTREALGVETGSARRRRRSEARVGSRDCLAADRREETGRGRGARGKTRPKQVVPTPVWEDYGAEENLYGFLRKTARSKNNPSS